jgi:hypothetical protein
MSDEGWELRKLRIKDISYGHSPDKRGERTDKWGKAPIYVKTSGGRFKVHDGNDRLYYAIQRGDTHIMAYVPVARSQEPASGGCLVSALAMMGGALGFVAGVVELVRNVV